MKRKTVTLCLIARDEEATIGGAIKSVLALVDEIIVVDTGSRDNTAIIAEGYGARVVDMPWEGDFALARNKALDMASGDWVLVLDADEVLQTVRPVEFQRLLHDPSAAAYILRITDGAGRPLAGACNRVRLFRNHPLLRFTYPVRENLETGLGAYCRATGHRVQEADLEVINEGETPQRLQAARERDQRILHLARENQPQEPYFAYLVGRSGLNLLDDDVLPTAGVEKSLVELRQAWRLSERGAGKMTPAPSWLEDLGCLLIGCHLAVGDTTEARRLAADLLAIHPHRPQVILKAAAADLARLRSITGAGGSLECRQISARIESLLDRIDDLPDRADPQSAESRRRRLYPLRFRGELALLEGRISDAVVMFERALDLDPGYSFAWLGMAECCRYAGDRKRALKHYLHTVAGCPQNYRAWLWGSRLMREMDCPGNAQSWWNRFCLEFPAHPAAGGDRAPNLLESTPA